MHEARNISNHFKTVYEDLYNEQEGISPNLVLDINNKIADRPENSKEVIELITPDLVKSAIRKLKSDKSDVRGCFTSDRLKSGPACCIVPSISLSWPCQS